MANGRLVTKVDPISLALDEAKECIVNRKLKQITTRPSHFRMVDMADFMAYLDRVVTGLDSHIFKLQKEKVSNKKERLYTEKFNFLSTCR